MVRQKRTITSSTAHLLFKFKLFAVLSLGLISQTSAGQVVLEHDYSFLGIGGGIAKLHQGHDTLYFIRCTIERECGNDHSARYRILSSSTIEEFIALKLERLDSIPLSADPYPKARFVIWGLNNLNLDKLGLLQMNEGLTRKQIDTTNVTADELRKSFFFTYLSDRYLKRLSTLEDVKTKEDAIAIVDETESDASRSLFEEYLKADVIDMYASGIRSEILNRACITKGYNPYGAGPAITRLMKEER